MYGVNMFMQQQQQQLWQCQGQRQCSEGKEQKLDFYFRFFLG